MGKFVMRNTNTGITFKFKSSNGQVIATSEKYSSEAVCRDKMINMQKDITFAAVENQTVEGYVVEKNPKFEVYNHKAGEFGFRLRGADGQLVVVSEGYPALSACLKGIAAVQNDAPDAEIVKE